MSDFGCRSGAGAAQRHDAASERGGRLVFGQHWQLKALIIELWWDDREVP